MKIQLIYFSGCPNAAGARDALRQALAAEHVPAIFDEIDTDSSAAPSWSRRWPSPTILIDGQDIASDGGTSDVHSRACRLNAPTVDEIRAHLRSPRPRTPKA